MLNIQSGEITVEQLQTPEFSWSFGAPSGYFSCNGETAFFEPILEVDRRPSMDMPLQELIGLLKEWKQFMS